ncbi:MAG TPA: ThuA domain-containing protein, partial [Algoriphagus sp.]|nr:ThuA domain-containing protein [Algoriphagus sp.]
MKLKFLLLTVCLLTAGLMQSQAQQFRALVFSKTAGFRHQ